MYKLSLNVSAVVSLMNIFRGVAIIGEKSQRVLDLITRLLSLNPANYTLWFG